MDPRDESEMFTWTNTGSVGACIRSLLYLQLKQATIPSNTCSHHAKQGIHKFSMWRCA